MLFNNYKQRNIYTIRQLSYSDNIFNKNNYYVSQINTTGGIRGGKILLRGGGGLNEDRGGGSNEDIHTLEWDIFSDQGSFKHYTFSGTASAVCKKYCGIIKNRIYNATIDGQPAEQFGCQCYV